MHCTDVVNIPRETQSIVFAKATCPDGVYLVESKNIFHHSLLLSEAVVEVKNGIVPVMLVNPTVSDITLKQNTAIAHIESFTSVSVDESVCHIGINAKEDVCNIK